MTVLAALATIGWLRILQPRVHHFLLPATVVGAVATNLAVWLMLLRSWYAPGLGDALHGLFRWSPLPYAFTVLFVVVLPSVASVIAVAASVVESRRLRAAGAADRLAPLAGPEVAFGQPRHRLGAGSGRAGAGSDST
jgi:hypothetical protein